MTTESASAGTAVVTGASSGIGQAVARRLALRGYQLALVGRSPERLEDTRRSLDSGGKHRTITADIGLDDEVASLVEQLADCAPLLSVVQCAGVFAPKPFELSSPENLDHLWRINTRAAFLIAQGCLPLMSADSTMVFVSSVSGWIGMADQSAYGMTKSAVEGLTRALAVELAPRNIRVNCVAPGFTRTAMNETFRRDEARVSQLSDAALAGRLGTPEEVARVIEFLATDDSAFVYGTVLRADGGYPTSVVARGIPQ